MDRPARLHALTEELRRAGDRGRTAAQLAAQFEVTTRTIKRDIAVLQSSGAAIWANAGPGGGYGVIGSSTLPPVNFTPAQAVSVALALTACHEAPFAADGRAALGKLLDVMDDESRARVDKLGTRVWIRREIDRESAEPRIRRVIEEGLERELAVSLRYVDREGARTERLVEPHILAHTGDTWFLVAWCLTRAGARWFRLDRVTDAILTHQSFVPRDPDLFGEPPPDARSVFGR
ncbi:helix-turn-helix transcriptional regulator [Rhodococcus marinonascens]|uniref:helix-turn-helix transcriptional regulator n=1 Tax=Rhodococcus marinonascens TaxID=38311 RepID=UPI00093213B7|nr:WYL domain-containing protein [Rhodococcus marinonascens]